MICRLRSRSPGPQIVARSLAELNGLTLGVIEASAVTLTGELVALADDLDPHQPAYGGGNWVPRSLTGPDLLVLIADILREDLGETAVAWGHARPPCPNPSTPGPPCDSRRAGVVDPPTNIAALYRIGRGEVPSGTMPSITWRKESRRARKRRHH